MIAMDEKYKRRAYQEDDKQWNVHKHTNIGRHTGTRGQLGRYGSYSENMG